MKHKWNPRKRTGSDEIKSERNNADRANSHDELELAGAARVGAARWGMGLAGSGVDRARARRGSSPDAGGQHGRKKKMERQNEEEIMKEGTKHTPGPWHTGTGNGDGSIFGPEGTRRFLDGLFPICKMNGTDLPEDQANARLIAAAPELLGALKEARSVLETASRYFPKSIQNTDRFNLLNVLANSVNPVIAKAEGRE